MSTSSANDAWPKAVLFDLDGTLVDSAPDIAAAANELLARDGLGPLSVTEVRTMVGHGVRKLVERAYAACGAPVTDTALEQRHAGMMDIYAGHLTNLTTLMPGAMDALSALNGAGAKVAVVTNKPEAFSWAILVHYGLAPFADIVVGGDTGPARKPAPDMLLHALAQFRLEPGDALMVGDGPADIDAARAADIRSVAVFGGYTNVAYDALEADIHIGSLNELTAAIARLRETA